MESLWYFCTVIFIDNIINIDTLRQIFNLVSVSDPLSFETSESEDNISGWQSSNGKLAADVSGYLDTHLS